jgi:aminoglycoside phosphotransferase (APT) family kinase protein
MGIPLFLSNLIFMARSPLILAALAKAAVPHLNFHEVKALTTGSTGAFDTGLLTATSGEHYIIRVANNQIAGMEQDVELRALKTIGKAERLRLPFGVTNLIGETKDEKGSRALVFEFIYGNPTDISAVAPDGLLSRSIAKAIGAIHGLDAAIIENEHLTSLDAAEVVKTRVAELDRFASTGKVPANLLSRWEQALEDTSLFRFKPTVIHGGLNSETVLSLDEEVSGILSWSTLKVSDPAEDFAWIVGAGVQELSESIIEIYLQSILSSDETLKQRATLYSEFEFARWLMFGISKNDSSIIDEAVLMLDGLAEEVRTGAIGKLISKPRYESVPAASAAAAMSLENPETLSAFENIATRPIELPYKPDNELF